MARRTANPQVLEVEIDELGKLDLAALRDRWHAFFGRPPPVSFRRKLLIRALAYEMQVKVYGGLSATAKRRLRAIAISGNANTVAHRTAWPKPGTRLIRDWNGITNVVDVAEDGYLWNGARYRSLSVIARTITGARRSGPRFFGLRGA